MEISYRRPKEEEKEEKEEEEEEEEEDEEEEEERWMSGVVGSPRGVSVMWPGLELVEPQQVPELRQALELLRVGRLCHLGAHGVAAQVEFESSRWKLYINH